LASAPGIAAPVPSTTWPVMLVRIWPVTTPSADAKTSKNRATSEIVERVRSTKHLRLILVFGPVSVRFVTTTVTGRLAGTFETTDQDDLSLFRITLYD